jgi:uncharacterized membrane protein YkoI
MSKRRTIAITAGTVAALAAGGAAIAGAGGGEDNERAITGPALERASAAALEATGGGEVTDTEVRDEEGFYEIEVTRPDGSQTDVHLDPDFDVLSQDADRDSGADDD